MGAHEKKRTAAKHTVPETVPGEETTVTAPPAEGKAPEAAPAAEAKKPEEVIPGRSRHVFVWKALRPIGKLIVWLRFRFKGRETRVGQPFLLVCNHVTDWDPILAACSFPEQIYFVSSEHLLRAGLGGKLVSWLQSPIPRQKSGNAAGTVLTVMRYLRRGLNVGIFPEGNRNWDGVTMEFLPSIAKLARSSGAALVTYKFTGGYFASPRWSGNSARRGKMEGAVVRVYSPEDLHAMTPKEINAHIEEDLYEDAYARQRKDPIRYNGRRLAEHMETLLFLCPRCRRMHTLQSRDDTVTCWKCGLSFRYLPTGFLSGDDIPYDNLRDWVHWQRNEIFRFCDDADDSAIFTDTDIRVDTVESAAGTKRLGKGDMKLFRDRLELPGAVLPLGDITGISLRGPQDLYISTNENHYLARSSYVRCMVKYLTAISHLNGDAHYGE